MCHKPNSGRLPVCERSPNKQHFGRAKRVQLEVRSCVFGLGKIQQKHRTNLDNFYLFPSRKKVRILASKQLQQKNTPCRDIFNGAGEGSRTLVSTLGRLHNSRYTTPAGRLRRQCSNIQNPNVRNKYRNSKFGIANYCAKYVGQFIRFVC